MCTTRKDVIKNLAPSWFAVVMGTGIIPIALSMAKGTIPIFELISKMFFFLSAAIFIVILIPWTIRFFRNFEDIKKDFTHPIAASFFPTFGISVMLLSMNFLVIGKELVGQYAALHISSVLFVIGGVSILALGFTIFPIMFIHNKIDLTHGNFAWFIPAVSHMFIPLVGLELINQYKGTSFADLLFLLSMAGFGIGFILFLYVGTAVYHRYIYSEVLMPQLAATLFIGMVPPALITTISVKLSTALLNVDFIYNKGIIAEAAGIIGIITWGFAFWWFITATIVILQHILTRKLPYALSWWAFTFPLGALTVATGSLGKLYGSDFFLPIFITLIFIMLIIWVIVAARTIKAVTDGSVF